MKTTKWRPDTCKCEIEYDWDETVPNSTHSNHKFIKQCLYHTQISDVISHNKIKNVEVTKLMSDYPLTTEIKDGSVQFKGGYVPVWEIKNGLIIVGLNQITDMGVIKIK